MARRHDNTEVVEHIRYSFVPNHRVTMEALAHARFSNEEFRVIIALLNQTNGYLREEDRLSLRFWSQLTAISRQHIWHALRRLVAQNVVSRRGEFYRVNLPDHWSPEVLKVLPEQATKPKRRRPLSSGVPLPERATAGVLPQQATESKGRGPGRRGKVLPEQATQPKTEKVLPEQATPVAQPGYTLLPGQATPPDTKSYLPKKTTKENSLKKEGVLRTPSPPSRSARGRARKETKRAEPGQARASTRVKPWQAEAGSFLDRVEADEGIQLPRETLMPAVRKALALVKGQEDRASPAELAWEWYAWARRHDRWGREVEPATLVRRMADKLPYWARRKGYGPTRQGPGEAGGHPGQGRAPLLPIESGPDPGLLEGGPEAGAAVPELPPDL